MTGLVAALDSKLKCYLLKGQKTKKVYKIAEWLKFCCISIFCSSDLGQVGNSEHTYDPVCSKILLQPDVVQIFVYINSKKW